MHWQFLETAPQDGTKLLLWARFHAGADAAASVVVGRYDYSFGWVSASAGVIPIVPTHWMPLPEAPLSARDLDLAHVNGPAARRDAENAPP
jgi:hypothetical protein